MHLRGVTVHITDSSGQNLREWGTQYLRQHTRGNRVSTYVQSTTDVSFQVSLQPNIPFIERDSPSSTLASKKAPLKNENRPEPSHEKKGSGTLSSSIQLSTTPQNHSAPDFAFLALLYLDGRTKPERKIIVYTDPADKDFNSPHGKVVFKHRWVQSADGRMIELAWVFKEKAIETVFDKLMIAGAQAHMDEKDDDALIKATQSSGLDAQGKTEKVSKVGQIVVELQRVILGEKRVEADYRPRHTQGQDEDIDMEGAQREITHATGFVPENTLKSKSLRVIDYWPYQPNEGPYATFQFFYRSREQLQQFHFPGFPSPPTTTVARTARFLNSRMADLTPLSISLPLDKKTKTIRREHGSFEANINKRGFKPDDIQKDDYGSEYRDVPATSPSAEDKAYEGKKLPKYPAAPLPILTNMPNENTDIGNHSLETKSATAKIPFLAEDPLALLPKHRIQSQGHARQVLNPDTPTSIVAEISSSSPSSTEFTKEQMAKITNKDDYRPTTRDVDPGDQEKDADDEPGTESDLETHVDDKDFRYATQLVDDQGYDSLQFQFSNVRICKRRREDAEEADSVWPGADAATLDSGRKEQTPSVPSTQEERAPRGKKSRKSKQTSAADGGQDARRTEDVEGVAMGQNHMP